MIQFNENSDISDAYNSNYFYEKSEQKFTVAEFILCEL